MTHSRSGTFLLICISLSALIIVIAFAFVRTLGWQRDASQTNQHMLLAQQAAREGLAHAMEQILLDQEAATITIATGSGNKVVSAPTFLDGPFRAAFGSLYAPNYNRGMALDDNTDRTHNDVSPEHSIMFPWMRYDGGDHLFSIWHQGGWQVYDGRGRYYEPGYYNVTRQVTGATPVANTPFLDPLTPLPERHDGIFFDEELRRIDTGDPVKDRQAARYRLRYAVGVEDLGGHLLVNPVAQMQLPSGYRVPPPWVRRGTDAFGSIVQSLMGTGPWITHYEHLFQGRGWFINVDRDTTTGAPVTFPLMYRADMPDAAKKDPTKQASLPWSKAAYGNELPSDFYQSTSAAPRAGGGEPVYSNLDTTYYWDQWRDIWDSALYNDPYHYPDTAQQGRYETITSPKHLS